MEIQTEELPKAYDPTEVEQRWYRIWQEAGVFRADASETLESGKPPYVIMMPPPNVTGTLHNGHALFVTIQDILIRFYRMKGYNALWLPGVDHAGIATQSVVERELLRHEGKTRHDLGREKFLDRVWDWKERNGTRIVEQLQVLGASADWTRERFTMDPMCSRAVREAFVRLWDEGLIYRGERLVNWDPKTRTALSNEEVEYEERDGELWSFAYSIVDSDDEIVVATTRPETMLGDTAVAVHPEDERHAHLIGRTLRHPFFPDRSLIVIGDEIVDREFGTGAVKVTPAHDPNDFDMGQRHGLEMINIFTFDGAINENGGPYAGLDRDDARASVKADLTAQGFFRGTETIRHNVSISERSGVAVEPMLSRQYFINAKPLAEKACRAIDELGETRIIPASWKSTWDHFMKNIRDWCISRQLWWGHRIPVFYDMEKLEAAVREDAERRGGDTEAFRALEADTPRAELLQIALNTLDDELIRGFSIASVDDLCESPDGAAYIQEADVLDTWFSSGLWPFSTLGWPDKTDDLKAFYPGAVLETGFDILFFWVARMMMLGCHFMGEAPFKDIFLHAMVRDGHGQKMSKSLGNAIDPLDIIYGIELEALLAKTRTYPVPEAMLPKVLKGLEKEYPEGIPPSGADGLRFSLAALSGQGRDVKLAIPRVAGYRAFLNKVWNATRFALMRIGPGDIAPLEEQRLELSIADRWILSRLQSVAGKVESSIQAYRFDEVANAIYQFFWNEFCDWYIELVKTPLMDEEATPRREAARSVLIHVLDFSMRLMHPLCPYQSEEIWQKLPGREGRWAASGVKFCANAPFPEVDESFRDEDAEGAMGRVIKVVTRIRNLRRESGLPQQKRVPVVLLCDDEAVAELVASLSTEITRLALLSSLEISPRSGYEIPRQSAVDGEPEIDVVLPLEGVIDLAAERERIEKDLEKARKELQGYRGKLSNEKYVSKAPPKVVEETRTRAADCEDRISSLEAALGRL